MGRLIATIILAGLACGGDDASPGGEFDYPQPNPTPPSQLQQLPTVTAPATGVVHVIAMREPAEGRYAFEPSTITIQEGDLVRWVVESGVPHNVAFYPESIPPGAAQFLVRAMPSERRISALGGRVLVQEQETFEILFLGAPAGSYRYVCIPHEFVGMKGTIRVRAR